MSCPPKTMGCNYSSMPNFIDGLLITEVWVWMSICFPLTHWGRVTHICFSKLTVIGSVNGLSPGRRQAIIWINAGILLIGPFSTNFSEILSEIQTFSLKKMHLNMSSRKWQPFCLSLTVLIVAVPESHINYESKSVPCSLGPICRHIGPDLSGVIFYW